MKNLIIITLIGFSFFCCNPSVSNREQDEKTELIIREQYELSMPEEQKGLLILFPCLPCDAENTRIEFDIDALALSQGLSVLRMNYNMHLWLSLGEKKELELLLTSIIDEHGLDRSNIVVGGFSGGANVTLLLTDYLIFKDSEISPKGLFVVDPPLDLLALYENAQENIRKNISEDAVAESTWIVNEFNEVFGQGDSSLAIYQRKSPFISKTGTIANVSHLQDVRIRFYSEPDTTWWMENRGTAYEGMNACYIEKLVAQLSLENGVRSVEYIATQGKGYRSNGDRHPHSWSIVDKEELISWILKD